MRIKDHKIVKSMNGVLRRLQLQELYDDEAEWLVMHYMMRKPQLDVELVLPYREKDQFLPVQHLKRVLLVVQIILEEQLDLLFTLRGIESIYCLKGRNYHENGEGDSKTAGPL